MKLISCFLCGPLRTVSKGNELLVRGERLHLAFFFFLVKKYFRIVKMVGILSRGNECSAAPSVGGCCCEARQVGCSLEQILGR